MEAKRALALAPRLPETHIAMGHVQRFVHHDFAAARDEFQQAVDLRPNDSKALGSLAIVEGWLGNEEAAIKALRQAVALDPQNSRSEEHTSELQSLMRISYAVFWLKKKKENTSN